MTDELITDRPVNMQERLTARRLSGGLLWILDHWLLLFLLLFGVWWIVPFFAPIFMRIGWSIPAQVIYLVYSAQCHQMAQRSIFLFGQQPMYNIAQLPVAMTDNDAVNTLALRAFSGNADLGWKVAWSDRMVYMYGAVLIAGVVFAAARKAHNVRWLRVHTFLLLLLPMTIDGATHFFSDITGGLIGGFRYSNHWLAILTRNTFPTWFYAGDAIGSFNSWMRVISGLVFGFALVWFAFPYIDRSFCMSAVKVRLKLAATQRAGANPAVQ